MKLFISWSGPRSKKLAELLYEWLPIIVQSVEPFISTQGIPPGGRGLNVLALELQNCSFGILCLTSENRNQPWINFEAGALSKAIDVSRVIPLLLDLKLSDITGPLAQFQAISVTNRDDVLKLVTSLAELSDSPKVSPQILDRTFNGFWPEFEARITELQAVPSNDGPKQQTRTDRELLEEILTLNRRLDRNLSTPAPGLGHMVAVAPIFEEQFRVDRAMALLRSARVNIGSVDTGGSLTSRILYLQIDNSGDDPDNLRTLLKQIARDTGITLRVRGIPIDAEEFSPLGV